ncbi:Glutamyl-tRNA(Gln) amidotransferase subunit A [Thalassoglobus neptunius]|uniref:Glutamyl-tRNA(Gln) amidotransferase subunit A n=1 Tax=Thalassoglobus neptunius TaxID=1938619 RepID=A0A5C5X6H1_9PLAN|nr:Asp-tRNA(Asn)/Glu-tRNA(Gln) amidotransferase subunit GatA [Thalassoglobus neptunius]TWT58530.1 Glutamyl-tRNA(Gln) amidotransferase subunit A [Thalassoglobus neptunius]
MIHTQNVAQLQSLMTSGEATSRQIVQAHLDAIAQQNERVGAFLETFDESALQLADQIDEKRQKGEPLGPLAGIPVAIKDNLCIQGEVTSCASKMLSEFRSLYTSTAVQNLLDAGAIPLGRTNLDEFAMGSSCENSAIQLTRNPWNTDCAPGGSSGGSAAAVAARMAPIALGSDTGGSIRQPAALCGIVGMKPTYGRVSRYGLVAFASSLDQIGPFARTVDDAAALLEAVWGHDDRDSTSVNVEFPSLNISELSPIENLRIGIVPEHYGEGLDPEVQTAIDNAVQTYKELGAEIVELEMKHAKYGVAAYYIIAPSEASSNLSRYDGVHYGHRADNFENLTGMYEASRGEGFGPEVKRRIMIGAYALSSGYYDAYYLKALKIRRLIAQDYQQAFEKVDVVLSPTSPTPAFRIGELSDSPLQMYLNDIYTIGANLAGIPGISIPAGHTGDGLPVGMQLLAPAYEEVRLLRAAKMFESATEFHLAQPAEAP